MRIDSGPKTERIIRNGIFFLMIAGFGSAFLKDGYVGYLTENVEEHLQSLNSKDREKAREISPKIYDSVHSQSLAAADACASKLNDAAQREAMVRLYGGPPSFESAEALYYFGSDYRVKFPIINGRIGTPVGSRTKHSRTDLRSQKLIGWTLSGVAVIAALVLIRILATRCVLDDAGLRYRFKGAATWDEMKTLESSRFLKKGWIDLVCSTSSGGERRIRLDEYHLKFFPEIVAEICRRKGFDNPVEAEKIMKARRATTSDPQDGQSS